MVLEREFYERPTRTVARSLLGTYLESRLPEGRVIGRIVETEAYLGRIDPGAHSYRGKTERTASMFGPPGRAYVYFIYGMHFCFNVATQEPGRGEAVLVRALEPIEGLELMAARRGTNEARRLCSGPGMLAQALGIRREHDGCDLRKGPLRIHGPGFFPKRPKGRIVRTTRIGLTKAADLPLRYYLEGNAYVSRRAVILPVRRRRAATS